MPYSSPNAILGPSGGSTKRKRRQSAPKVTSSPNSILGGAGVRSSRRSARKLNRSQARRDARKALKAEIGSDRASRLIALGLAADASPSRVLRAASRENPLISSASRGDNQPLPDSLVALLSDRPEASVDPTTGRATIEISDPDTLAQKAREQLKAHDPTFYVQKAIDQGVLTPESEQLKNLAEVVGTVGAVALGPETLAVRSLGTLGRALLGGERIAAAGSRALSAERVAGRASRLRPSAVAGASKARVGQTVERATEAAGKTRAGQAASRVVHSPAGRATSGTIKTAAKPVRVLARNKKRVAGASVTSPLSVGGVMSATQGNLDPLKRELEGRGATAAVFGKGADLAASVTPSEILSNAVRDAVELPAQVVPSVYIPADAGVQALGGDSEKLDALVQSFVEDGFIPQLLQGDFEGAGEAFREHPLYSALELRGATAAGGRATGAVGRATGAPFASTSRAPLQLGGALEPVPRRYSPDVTEKAAQVFLDRRRERKRGGQIASTRERERALRERVDRKVSEAELVRRAHRSEEMAAAQAARPSRSADADVVSLAVQGVIRSPRTFANDLRGFARTLDDAYKSGSLSKPQRIANRELHASVKRATKSADPEIVFAAARPYIEGQRAAERGLIDRGLLNEDQAEKAAAIPYAVTHMNARIDHPAAGGPKRLVDADGHPLAMDRIREHMERNGVDAVAFVTQRPSARGPGSFYRAMWDERQSLPSRSRSGKATAEGTFDASYDALAEQRVRTRGIADAAQSFDDVVSAFSVTSERFRDFRSARDAIRDPGAHGIPANVARMDLVPVRIAPLRAGRDEIRRAEEIFDDLDPSKQDEMTARVGDALDAAQQPGPGPVVLMPKYVVNRLAEHFARTPTNRKAMQAITNAFKGVVLPLSPKWLAGNVIDVSMRSLLAGLGPGDYRLGRRLVSEVERRSPEAAERLEAHALSGGHFGSAEHTRTHRDARQFASTRLAPLATALGTLRRTPGPKQAVDAYIRYRDAVFGFNERFIERQPQYAALGKEARRELQATTGKWRHGLMVGEDALKDLADGLLKTENQIQYAKAVEDVFGQWKANSPAARAFLADYAPFGMWTRAATKFVVVTLPAKHPMKTAVLAAAAEMTQFQREELGLSHFAERPLPPELQGSIPLDNGGILPVQAFTTFGVFSDYQSSFANAILPQFSGAIQGASGLDFRGEKLVDQDGKPLSVTERAKVALYTQSEAMLPFLALTRRVREQGGSSATGSTAWDPKGREGTAESVGAGFERVFNPFRPYEPGSVEYLRSLSQSQQITVPVDGEKDSSSGWWVKEGGASSNPWWRP